MRNEKRIIKKSSGSKGRLSNAAESGKRTAKARHGRATNGDGESVLVIEGEFTAAQKKDIFALIESTGLRATRKNPKQTVDLIEEGAKSIVVFVSDNHLALALGKALHRSHKGGELTITWSHDDEPVRVHWMKK